MKTAKRPLYLLVAAATLASTTAAVISGAPPASLASSQSGNGWGVGQLGPGGAKVGVGTSPNQGGAPTPDPPPSSRPPIYYRAVECSECTMNGEVCLPDGKLGLVPVSTGEDPLGHLPPGDTVPEYIELIDATTGRFMGYLGRTVCGAPVPPPPPSPLQVWDTAPLPSPKITISPATVGLTQLPSWFWLGNDAAGILLQVGVPGGIAGYSVVLAVHPVAYYWAFGDGAREASRSAGGPGGAAMASALHTYTEPGTYRVGVIVAWAGVYIFTGFGVTDEVPLGSVDEPEAETAYEVEQVRGVLVPSGGLAEP